MLGIVALLSGTELGDGGLNAHLKALDLALKADNEQRVYDALYAIERTCGEASHKLLNAYGYKLFEGCGESVHYEGKNSTRQTNQGGSLAKETINT